MSFQVVIEGDFSQYQRSYKTSIKLFLINIFRHHETKTVRQRIEGYGLKKDETDAIMKKLEDGHYQIACGMHFAAVHLKELSTGSVSHPNQWYLESRGEGGQGGAASNRPNKNIKTTKATVYSQTSSSSTQSTTQSDDQSQLDMMDDSELLEAMEAGS